jgi:hypothetical protein
MRQDLLPLVIAAIAAAFGIILFESERAVVTFQGVGVSTRFQERVAAVVPNRSLTGT